MRGGFSEPALCSSSWSAALVSSLSTGNGETQLRDTKSMLCETEEETRWASVGLRCLEAHGGPGKNASQHELFLASFHVLPPSNYFSCFPL